LPAAADVAASSLAVFPLVRNAQARVLTARYSDLVRLRQAPVSPKVAHLRRRVRNWPRPCQRAPLSPRRSRTSSVFCRGAACGADLKKHDGDADADHGAGRKRLRGFAGEVAETDLPEPEPPRITVCRGFFDRDSSRMAHVRPLRSFSTPHDGLLPLGKHRYSDDFLRSSSASGQVLCRP
jgi:hypothetical protein